MPPQVPETTKASAFATLAIAILVAVAAWLQLTCPLNHDASWYLHVARGLLGGKHLYTDFIEVNPPLGMWLMVPVVWAADILTLPADTIYKTSLLFLSIVCIAFVNRYVKLGRLIAEPSRPLFIVLFAAGVLLLPAIDFGEREHLIALLFAPWLMLRAARGNCSTLSLIEAAIIGGLAAVAIVLKPQSVFAPLLVEALLLWQSRDLRKIFVVENVTAGAVVVVYALVIFSITPQFLSDMVPLGRAAYMPFYGYPWLVQAFNARWCLLFIALAIYGMRHLQGADRRTTGILLCAAVGFAMSYAVQNKGFSYQIMPATVFAWAATACVFSEAWKRRARDMPLLAAIAGIGVLNLITEPQQYRANDSIFRAGIRTYAPQAKSIFIASTRLSHGFPLVEDAKLQWASRLPTQWLAPYVAQHLQQGDAAHDKIVQLALTTTVTDLGTKPDIIFVDQDADQVYVPGGAFDYVAFWKNDPRFAPLWQDYKKVGDIETFAIYTRK